MSTTPWGTRVERYARFLAADLGVPDFVYEPKGESKGAATREVSDGMLICGNQGLIVQSKARDPAPAEVDTPARVESWLRKNAEKGRDQADGTRRRLSNGSPVTFTSLRGFDRSVTGIGDWPAVVILHHAQADGVALPYVPNTFFLTLEDWHGLHDRLRSTVAVIDYVERALACGSSPPLGHEYERYLALSAADERAPGGPQSVPLLPPDALSGDDEFYAAIVSDWIEKVWPQDGAMPWKDINDYLRIVELLDRIPPAARVILGRRTTAIVRASEQSSGRRSAFISSLPGAQYCFVADHLHRFREQNDFSVQMFALAAVRHEEMTHHGNATGPTLVIGRLRSPGNGVAYSFAGVDGAVPVDNEVRWTIVSDFGALDANGRPYNVENIGRNHLCPCGSNRKFKQCHLSRMD